MTIEPELLKNLLNTKILGKPAICLDQTDSTNLFIKSRLHELPVGTAVLTLNQTAGRGRLDRSWNGSGGALAMSVLLRMDSDAAKAVPLCAGLAVCGALNKFSRASFKIKWPNDIICDGSKICGILCESSLDLENHEMYVICGIGINLTQSDSFFKESNLPYASSVYTKTGTMLDPTECAAEVLNRLEAVYDMLTKGQHSQIMEMYSKHCVTLRQHIRVIQDGVEKSAFAVGIADDGSLLADFGGEIRHVYASEASVRGLFDFAQ